MTEEVSKGKPRRKPFSGGKKKPAKCAPVEKRAMPKIETHVDAMPAWMLQ